jgi:thioesterase domain-containing protein
MTLYPGSFVTPPEVETGLADIFCRVLGSRTVDRHDAFFDIGGSSIRALEAIAAIREEIEPTAPLSLLYEEPTIAGIARVLTGGAPSGDGLLSCTGRWKTGPIICLPSTWGTPLDARYLAAAAAPRGVVTIRAVGLAEGEEPLETIEDMARVYSNEIRRAEIAPPYTLLGHCAAGAAAYGMAQFLGSKCVELVGLIDTAVPEGASEPRGRNDAYEMFHLGRLMALNAVQNGDDVTAVNWRILARLAHRILPIMYGHSQASHSYTMRPYDGDVVLFQYSLPYPGLPPDEIERYHAAHAQSWRHYVSGGLRIVTLPGCGGFGTGVEAEFAPIVAQALSPEAELRLEATG